MDNSPSPSIRLEQVDFAYGQFALSQLNLALGAGSVSSLIGPSGSGKSTLLRLIAGFLQPSHGSIYFGDECIATPTRMVPATARKVGLVFQNYALFPHMRVSENIMFGCPHEPSHLRLSIARDWAQRLGIEPLMSRYPHEISGGEQQRVALARALAANPRILLLDEPFANLDSALRKQVREDCFALLRARRITTLLVTHDEAEAEACTDQMFRMHQGTLSVVG
jgi:iron(III) transport system ATP-binding protein